jgi:NAD dependent epimerase/dehydratase family enzyme
MDAIAAALRVRLLRLPLPERVLRAVLGELAQLLVDGQRVVPVRATALGFHFRFATVSAALDDLLRRHREHARVAPTP